MSTIINEHQHFPGEKDEHESLFIMTSHLDAFFTQQEIEGMPHDKRDARSAILNMAYCITREECFVVSHVMPPKSGAENYGEQILSGGSDEGVCTDGVIRLAQLVLCVTTDDF